MKTKLLCLMLASTGLTAAFADTLDCTNVTGPDNALECIVHDYNQRAAVVKKATQDAFNKNYGYASNAFAAAKKETFLGDALNQRVAYRTSVKAPIKDIKDIAAAVKAGDFDTAKSLSGTFQADRDYLFNSPDTNLITDALTIPEVDAAAFFDHKLFKSKTDKYTSYANAWAGGALASEVLINAYELVESDVPTYINAGLDSITPAMCHANVDPMQANIQALAANNGNVRMIFDMGGPNSMVKSVFAAMHANVMVDSLNSVYAFGTGKSPIEKGASYDVCDYATFQAAVKSGNIYAVGLNQVINKILSDTHSKVAAEKVYMLAIGVEAKALNNQLSTFSTQSLGGSATPFSSGN